MLVFIVTIISTFFVIGLIFLLNRIFPAGFSKAATVTWSGVSSSTWQTAGNWSNSAVPTSADDVTISSSTAITVTLWTAQLANFNNLTVGGGAATTTLILIGNIGTGTNVTIENNGVLEMRNATAQTITGTLTIKAGGVLTHTTNGSAQAYKVDFTAQTIDLRSGGLIDVAGKGYAGRAANVGQGPGAGAGAGGSYSSGAGHGGQGGDALFNGHLGGKGYCDFTDVNTIGSSGGGGFSTGGAGGGLVRLYAVGTITLNGMISASGSTGSSNLSTAAGAGGGVKISANTVAGTPSSFSVAGGSAGSGTSGGGGGCVQIAYTTSNSIASSQIVLGGGASGGGNGGYPGGGGLLYVKQASASYGDLYSNSTFTSANATTTVSVQNLTLNSLSLSRSKFIVTSTQRLTLNNESLTPFANSSASTPGTLFIQGGTVDLGGASNLGAMNLDVHGGTLINPASLTVGAGGALLFFGTNTMTALTSVSSSGQLYLKRGAFSFNSPNIVMNPGATTTLASFTSSSQPLVVADLTINNNALLTHETNASIQANVINIAANNITVASGGSVNVDGKGFSRNVNCYGSGYGYGGGGGSSFVGTGAGGGAHGGGGGFGASGSSGGTAYCNVSNVGTMGSAGGDGSGCFFDAGAGGGLIIMSATTTFAVNGTISAKGNAATGSTNSGSGAGGGVKITAGTVTGTPTLFSVVGGNSPSRGGGGGGGCVRIGYGSSSSITSANLTLTGGTSSTGGAGGVGLASVSSTVPTAPSVPYSGTGDASTGSTNPTNLTSLTPTFSAICNTPNSDTCTSVEIEVADNSGFTSPRWQSGQLSITAIASSTRSQNILYAGSQLKYNTTYYWRIRFYNAYGAGVWSAGTNTFYAPRTIELYSFNLGGAVQSGRSIPITWGSIGGSTTTAETVKIEYSVDNFATTVATATSSVASGSSSSTVYSYAWTIPSATAVCGASSCSTVRVRISSNNDGNNYIVTGEQNFTIQNSLATGIKYGRTFSVSDFFTTSDLVSVTYNGTNASVASQTAWSKRKAITVTNNTATALTNFEVSIPVTYDSDMQADFDDIRFTSSDGSTFISYWLETKTDSTSATFWVKVPSIGASSAATIYMYYGNSVVSTVSSATTTFLFADDFSGTFDSSKWTTVGTPAHSSGLLNLPSSNYGIWSTSYTLPGDSVIEASVSKSTTSYGNVGAANSSQRWLQEMTGASGFDYLMYNGSIYVEANGSESGFSSWANTAFRRAKLIYRSGVSVKAYDNSTNTTLSSTVPLSSTGLHVQIYNYSGTMQADWVFVRQYASTDPSVSTAAEESTFLSSGVGGSSTDYSVDFLAGHAFTSASSFAANSTGDVRYQLSNDNGATWKYCVGNTLTSASASASSANWPSEITDACLANLTAGTLNIRTYLSTPTSSPASTVDYVALALSTSVNSAPVAPTSTSGVTATSITYNWTSGGGDGTYYSVEQSVDGIDFTNVATTTLTNYTFTGLATNTPYWFRVASADGLSATSSYATSSQTYTLATTPNAPTSVTPIDSTSFSLLIDTAALNGNDPLTTTFYVKDTGTVSPRYLRADRVWTATPVGLTYTELGSGAGVTTLGLTQNSLHTISVAAINGSGLATSYGPSISLYTYADVPGRPSVSGITTSTIDVSIISFDNPDSTEYAVYNETAGNYIAADGSSNGSTPVWQTRLVWGNPVRVINLSANTYYQFRVYARNGDGVVTAASNLSEAASTSGVNNPSLSPVTSNVTTNSVQLDWTSGNGTETLYALDFSTDGAVYNNVATISASSTSYTFTDLAVNTQYWFRVASGDGGLNATSSYVASAPVFTLAATPNAPALVSSDTPTTLTVTIDSATINGNPQTVATTYRVRDTAPSTTLYLQLDGTWGVLPAGFTYAELGSGAPTLSTGLTPNSPHTISVAAVNGDGTVTAYGAEQSAATRASVPTNPALVIDTDNNATLRWVGDANEYFVQGNGLRSAWQTSLFVTFTNLTCDTRYSFQIKGRNIDGVETDLSSPVFGVSAPCGGWALWNLPSTSPETGLVIDDTSPVAPDGSPEFTIIALKAEAEVAVGESSQVTIGSSVHTLTINNATSEAVNITLHSDPITATLRINVPQDFDTDGDGITDVRALYTGIVNGKTQIFFTALPGAPIMSTTTPAVATSTPEVVTPSSTAPVVAPQVPTYTFTKALKRGSAGDEVIELQKRLKREGFFPQAVDYAPTYGAITEFAVRTYQKARGLPETGSLDQKTRETLNGVTNTIKVVPISDKYFFTQTIRRGSVGVEVFQLQTLLLDLGFFPESAITTNFFGPITQNSLDVFQKANKILGERDGRGPYTGAKTRAILNK